MKRRARFLILLCSIAIAGLLALQFYWISNYYSVNKIGFEKEVNLAFEESIKKEFSLRCDTLEQLIAEKLMDTIEFEITSELREDGIKNIYNIINKKDTKDRLSFSPPNLNEPIIKSDSSVKKAVAAIYADMVRKDDLEKRFIFFRTQNMGRFISEKVKQYAFDTVRLRPILSDYLKKHSISIPYFFHLSADDSIPVNRKLTKQQIENYPVITNSFPTYRLMDDHHFVRAMFSNPFSYIVSKMKFIFISSILLILLVVTSIFLLFKMWLGEKKLSVIKNDFISNITHEFKTPIATVSAAIEALSDFNVLDNRQKTSRYLDHSKNELKRLSSLVDKLLHISIYETSQLELKPEQINLEESIQAIIQTHLVSALKPIRYTFTNKTGIQFIKVDRIQFHHAINNIIDNAIKYSGAQVSIEIDCIRKENFLILSFADNGNGIPSKEIPFVFDKFYRVKTSEAHLTKGHGLGLNYVKTILEQHGGWCSVKSKIDQGTVINLAWPL